MTVMPEFEDIEVSEALNDARSKDMVIHEKEDGEFVFVDLDLLLEPMYAPCDSCTVREDCKFFSQDEDCEIERNLLREVMRDFVADGVDLNDSIDRLTLFPLIQDLFTMIRLYRVQNTQNMVTLLSSQEGQKAFKILHSVLNDTKRSYMSWLKEMLATRKARESRKGKKKPKKERDAGTLLMEVADEEQQNANSKK